MRCVVVPLAAACPVSTVHGTEAATDRNFSQTFDAVGGGRYPSIVTVPAPACRTPAASVAGQRVGSITVRAVQ